VSEPKSVAGVVDLIGALGQIHDCGDAAAPMIEDLQEALRALPRRAFTFACPIWKDPWMWCGGDTYVSDLVACAGGTNVLASRTRYPQMALDDVLTLSPDIIFLPDEPYLFTDADARAIPAKTMGPFPGHLFTWHGSRTIAGLRWLAAQPLEG
jgi:ABC-type Fe3+-hydroxamate transport system substrate-binding protein